MILATAITFMHTYLKRNAVKPYKGVVNIFTRQAIFLSDGGISIQQIQSGI